MEGSNFLKRQSDTQREGFTQEWGNGAKADPPKQATAAQMAARKIKQPRRPAARSTNLSSSQGSFGGAAVSPFSNLNPNALQNNQPQTSQTNGFTFGTAASNPFSNLNSNAFSNSQPQQSQPSAFTFGSSSQSFPPPTSSSSFNFGGNGFQGNNPFASISTPTTSAPPAFSGSIFSTTPANPPATAPPTFASFNPQIPTQEKPAAPLFGSNSVRSTPDKEFDMVSATPSPEDTAKKPALEDKSPAPSFGFNFSKPVPEQVSEPAPQPVLEPVREPAPEPSPEIQPPATSEETEVNKPSLEEAPSAPVAEVNATKTSPEKSSSTSNLFANVLKSAEAKKTPTEPVPAPEAEKSVGIQTMAPTHVPSYLSEEARNQVDRAFRLRALNTEFKKRIAQLDPATSDIDNLVRFYVACREDINQSIGLYERAMAGTKRKAEPAPQAEESSEAVKKPRQTEPEKAPSPPKFNIPSFGGSSGTYDFMSQFGAQSKKNVEAMQKEAREKRKAEDFDSDEDDEAEFDRKLEEEERAKRAKVEELAKTSSIFFKPTIPGPEKKDSPPKTAEAETPKPASLFAPARPFSPSTLNGASVFDSHKSPSPQPFVNPFAAVNTKQSDENESDADDDEESGDEDEGNDKDDDEKKDPTFQPEQVVNGTEDVVESEESDDENDLRKAMAKSRRSSKNQATPSSEGRSLFDRLTPKPATDSDKPETTSTPFGASTFSFNSPKDPPGTGLFGSGRSTPVNGTESPAPSTIFNFNTSFSGNVGDHTWKPETPIKFGSSTRFGSSNEAPAINVSTATPNTTDGNTKKPFGNLFGASPNSTSTTPKAPSVGFSFGAPSAGNALTNGFQHLAPSVLSSADTSRATSPGATDDSANEGAEEAQKDTQLSLLESRPGEENEDVLYEVRAKLLKQEGEPKEWKSMGVGPLRILKDKTTGKVRMVLRADPAASVILNTGILPGVSYKPVSHAGKESSALKFASVTPDGALASRVLKVKTVAMAQEMSSILEKEKSSGGSV